MMMSAGPFAAARRAGSPAVNAWMTNCTRWRTHRTSRERLVTMELRAVQPQAVHDLRHAFGPLVAEHAHRDHLGGQALDDVVHGVGRDLAAAGGEHEADRVGTERSGEQRVVFVRDPADLHPHRQDPA